MICPNCGYNESKVTDSRPTQEGTIKRRRACLKCNERFSTIERIENTQLLVEKRNGSLQDFDIKQIERGIAIATASLGISDNQISRSAAGVEDRLRAKNKKTVSSDEIGTSVLEELKELNPVAWLRFASVYNNFTSIEDFENAISNLHSD